MSRALPLCAPAIRGLAPALLAVLACALLPSTARAERVALLPLEGEGLLTKTRSDLDDELRAALAKRGLDVQPRATTEAMVAEAQGAGLGNCPLTDDVCVRRVGQIAEVETVFRATIELVDERMVLRVSRLAVQSEAMAQKTAGEIKLPALDDGKSLRAVLTRALTGKGQPTVLPFSLEVQPPDAALLLDGKRVVPGTLWLEPGSHVLEASAVGFAALERELVVREDGEKNQETVALTPLKVEVPVMRYVGLGLLGIGGLALVAGGVTTALVETSLNDPQPLPQRSARQQFGLGALVTTGAGATAAVVGGVFALAGGTE
jgi:hypothetical protein